MAASLSLRGHLALQVLQHVAIRALELLAEPLDLAPDGLAREAEHVGGLVLGEAVEVEQRGDRELALVELAHELKVPEEETLLRMFLDLDRSVHVGEGDDGTEEAAVRICASIARYFIQANRTVGFLSFGDDLRIDEPDRGMNHYTRILESLALARAVGDVPVGKVILEESRYFGRHTTLVVVTPSTDDAWALSLMALSLVLLTGYAGEINLAVYTFAGVALIVAWQFDVGPDGLATKESLSLKAVVLAMAVCALVGGLIALPALRLSGLYLALREGSNTVVPVLLSWPGIALDAENAVGETPLMMAALKGRVEVMNTLIQRGARINKAGWTPLHYAAAGPSLDAVELLLAHDAALEAIAPNGNTPLMMAAGYGAIDSARLLLRRGADARPRNQGGRDAADLAKAADRLGLAQELRDAAAAAR